MISTRRQVYQRCWKAQTLVLPQLSSFLCFCLYFYEDYYWNQPQFCFVFHFKLWMFPIVKVVVWLPRSLIRLSPGGIKSFHCFSFLMTPVTIWYCFKTIKIFPNLQVKQSSILESSGKLDYYQETNLSKMLEGTLQFCQLGTSDFTMESYPSCIKAFQCFSFLFMLKFFCFCLYFYKDYYWDQPQHCFVFHCKLWMFPIVKVVCGFQDLW